MAEKNNGWEKPEEKFPETEFEDSFAGFFSEEEEMIVSEKGKKRRKSKKGPDILAVSEETDEAKAIKDAIKKLKDKERFIIIERFITGKTQMELAEEIGISQAQISRLEKSGLENIKRMIS